MSGESCTAAGCYLEQHGGLVSFPLVTLAGLVDGINPCAIGMILLLLGYLLVFAKKPKMVLPLGLVYIITVYLTYLLVGLFFLKSINFLNLTPYRFTFEKFIGTVLLFAGLINIKDFLAPQLPIHLGIPVSSRKYLLSLVEKASLPAVILLAILVTLLETPCSLPIYVGTITVLSQSGLPLTAILGYFLYYNFLFVLPLLVILFLVWRGREMINLKEWEHKAKRWMKLSLGILLVLLAAWLLI